MQSKTSCFNVGIFKHNLKRFWPIAVMVFLLFLVFLPGQFYSEWAFRSDYYKGDIGNLSNFVPANLCVYNVPAFEFIFSAIAVLSVFGYLFSTRSSYMMSVFPVERKTWLFTNIISVLFIEIVPVILNVIIALIFCALHGLGGAGYLFFFLAQNICYFLVFNGIAMISAFVAGNYLGAIGSYVLLNFISYMAVTFIYSLEHVLLLGYSSDNLIVNVRENVLSPCLYLSQGHIAICCTYQNGSQIPTVTIEGIPALIIYSLAGIALMAVCYLIGKVRRTETAGDLISFDWLKKVFQIVVAAFVSVKISEIAVCSFRERFIISYSEAFFWMILCVMLVGFIAFYAFEMFAKKTLRVFNKKQLKNYLLYSAGLVLLIVIVRLDPIGYEDVLPNAEEVEWAGFNYDRSYVYSTGDAEDIINFQKMLVENKSVLRNLKTTGVDYADSVTFKYKKKDGNYLYRRYYIVETAQSQALYDNFIAVIKEPERMKEGLINPNWKEFSVTGGEYYVETPVMNDGEVTYEASWNELTLSNEKCNELYQAVLKDIDEGNVNPLYLYGGEDTYVNQINFYLTSSTISPSCAEIYDEYYDDYMARNTSKEVYFSIVLEPSMRNTIDKMLELGVIGSEKELILQSEIVY